MTATSHRLRPAAQRQVSWTSVGIALLAVAGLVVVLYPSITSWFSARAHQATVDAYTEQLQAAPPQELAAAWDSAQAYNAAIPEILLTDPYTIDDALTGRGGAYDTYQQMLSTADTDVMARIRIPAADIDLPVYHGTEDEVLELGAGHLFGSSLPVGGPGTHSVLTAHNGLVEARMFDDLFEVEVGDTVVVEVLGRTLTYRVTGSRTVLPTEVSSLALTPGADLLTLVTCTPTGVNTHRLLVEAERDEEAAPAPAGSTLVAQAGAGPGFPWWAAQLIGGSIVLVLLVLRLTRSPNPGAQRSRPAATADDLV